MKKILVIDVGGTNIKLFASGQEEPVKIASGPNLSAQGMMEKIRPALEGWEFDAVSIGLPTPVLRGKILRDPVNLGEGWVGFDFDSTFGKPVRLINDAAMQAIGSYHGGRMLFLGLGTGLGSTLIVEHVVSPMELGHLPYRKGKSFEQYVGSNGLDKLGKKRWRLFVEDVVCRLKAALVVDYVVLGGGNSKKLKELPEGAVRGSNDNAFVGGFRLWDENSPFSRQ